MIACDCFILCNDFGECFMICNELHKCMHHARNLPIEASKTLGVFRQHLRRVGVWGEE
ncbi:hypothetical protein CPL00365_CDS0059 [Klebsiella phage SmellyBerry]